MKIAKWSESEQKPYDIREFGSLKAGNEVPFRNMPSHHKRGYYEYQPVALAEGEGLDNETHSKPADIIMQGGQVISAQEMAARAQSARHDQVLAMADAYGADVAILGRLLGVFGITMPCDPAEAFTTIKGGLATGAIDFALAPQADAAEGRYRTLREHMTDEDIAAVASVIGGGA